MEPKTINTIQYNKDPASKSSKKLVFVLLALFIVLVMGIFWITNQNNTKITHTNSGLSKLKPAVVIVTSSGFVPSTISIKTSQAVEWTNNTTFTHLIASDPYPTDNGIKGFKSRLINPSDTYSFVFSKAGTYTYHDDLNPYKYKGIVIVKN